MGFFNHITQMPRNFLNKISPSLFHFGLSPTAAAVETETRTKLSDIELEFPPIRKRFESARAKRISSKKRVRQLQYLKGSASWITVWNVPNQLQDFTLKTYVTLDGHPISNNTVKSKICKQEVKPSDLPSTCLAVHFSQVISR